MAQNAAGRAEYHAAMRHAVEGKSGRDGGWVAFSGSTPWPVVRFNSHVNAPLRLEYSR